MQKYVEAAAQGMERISAAGKSNADVAAANRQVVEEFDQKLQEFAQYQKLSCKTMEQVRRLLTDISAAGSSDRVQLTAGRNLQKESLEKLQETMQKIVNDSNGGMICIII